ncbi:MAG TPA: tetratricopeptide repeat protein [bacterium]|nr:tetratricopeptide repeat protein [bacterium]HPR88336.1 tetratricopeptide repeat protein [bacterium]
MNLLPRNGAVPLLRRLLIAGLLLGGAAAPALAQSSSEWQKSSDRLFSEARRHYLSEKYWEAARDLILLLDFNPEYEKNDEVVYTLAQSLYEIGLPQGAERLYQHLITRYLRSPLQPDALLGLERIEYDRQEWNRCLEYHQIILRSVAPSTVTDAANYFAGMAQYQLRDFPKSMEQLVQVSVKSPWYPFAQYNLALAQMRMKQVPRAVVTLRAICDLPVESEQVRSLIDECHLTLGYLFYELERYRPAYEQFLLVSPTHEHRDEALLAAGWCLVQLGNLNAAIKPLTQLLLNHTGSASTEEGLFLLGRCFMKLKRYDHAIRVYDHLIALFPSREEMPAIQREVQTALLEEGIEVEKLQTDLLIMESELIDALPLQVTWPEMPADLRDERQQLLDLRQGLLRRIQEERVRVNRLVAEMDELRRITRRKESRMDWRAYAEFGKSRALFMQSMP